MPFAEALILGHNASIYLPYMNRAFLALPKSKRTSAYLSHPGPNLIFDIRHNTHVAILVEYVSYFSLYV